MAIVHIGKHVMTDHSQAEQKTIAKLKRLLTGDVSTNKTFYVGRITGDHPKYGLDREFITSKQSPYSLQAADFEEGEVYEIKDDREALRAYFSVEYPDDEPLGDDVPFHVTVVDQGDSVDEDAILDIVEGETDGRMAGVRNRVHTLVDEAADPEALEAMATMLENTDDVRDPGELTHADLSQVPTAVRDDAQLFAKCFSAAFEKHTGQSAGVHHQAAALDGAVLAKRKKREAANGGGAQ